MSRGFTNKDDLLWAEKNGELRQRVESGETLARLARELSLGSGETMLFVALVALGDGRVDLCPDLVSGKPRTRETASLTEASVATLYPDMARPSRLALSAGLLQMYDFWDASHEAAQEADDLGETSVSAYWHGIAHRREPDPGNASYWFRRVNAHHPVFARLADVAPSLLEAPGADPALAARLLPRGAWDPFAFIDVCSRASGDQAALARGLQRLEMLLLLEASLPAADRSF